MEFEKPSFVSTDLVYRKMRNCIDMMQGALNRISVADDEKEVEHYLSYALVYLSDIFALKRQCLAANMQNLNSYKQSGGTEE